MSNGDDDQIFKVWLQRGYCEVDYLLYEPSANRSVAGITLLLDDQEEGFVYSGTWNHTVNATFSTGSAMRETISQTRTKGSTFKAKFVGSTFTLYGAVQQVPGNVTINYSLDGTFNETVTISPDSVVNQSNWSLNHRLFGQDNLTLSGDETTEHTLDVTLMDLSGDQMLSIDYLTFTGTPWTNVTSPGSALATPLPDIQFPDLSRGGKNRKLAIGLGVSLPLVALIIGVGVFLLIRRRRATKK